MSFIFEPSPQVGIPVVGRDERFPVRRVYCVGRNYAAHAREMGFDPDREPPFFFCKPADAIVAAKGNESLAIPYPSATSNYQYEIELVVAISKAGKDIPVEHAPDYIFGYAVGIDMTRRDLQMKMREAGRPWELGKAFDKSAPIAQIHPASEIEDIGTAEISLSVNGETKQKSDISKLIWSVNETISYLSKYFELQPGDLIYTGTPEGVGAIVPGDLVEGKIDGLTSLSVEVTN
ncbi:fumarylacetoacetate hydrolase family protein [Achromobacter denitrificans]